jgi:hypothetical protein
MGGLLIGFPRSDNEGKSFAEPVSASLPNPNSKVMVTRLSTGELALCYNGSPRTRDRLKVTTYRASDVQD